MNELMALSANELQQQVNLIQQVMNAVMKDGTHYGKIPGCGDKPTLLKPGAEKLSMTFRLRPVIDNDRDVRVDDLGNGHREVTVYCHILNSVGDELATGVGSCSTMESKYRYRGGEKVPTGEKVPSKYWNLKNAGKISEAKESIGGDGYGVAKIDGTWIICEMGEKMENPDIADTYNTVLKMAKKRAYVDGILSATAASDIFTQDIEDFPTNQPPTAPPPQKAPVQPPKAAKADSGDEPPPPSDDDAPGGSSQQGELLSANIPNCAECGMPVATTEAEAKKVISWCEKKGYGAILCRNCQPGKAA